MSETNSKLWEARLELAERSRQEYRENARHLLSNNEHLQDQVKQTERDTIDVITYLKRQDQEKDRQIEKIMNQMKDQKKEHRKEKEQLVDDFQMQTIELEKRLTDKTTEVEVLQNELKQVKEFRKKRAQMQKELEEIKEVMFDANQEHKDTLTRMEQKFFEEKMRLQQEANQKIAELAEKAHSEAIANLDETTRSVYKENVRVSEALAYHMAEGEKLKQANTRLEEETQELQSDKQMNDMLILEKVSQSRKQKNLLKELQEKVDVLEKSLSHIIKEFDTERKALVEKSKIENEALTVEIAKLQRTLELKTKEMSKVRKLAKNILEQRTEMERFFLESLQHVKQEITATRMQYRRDAQMAYQQKMLDAYTGKGDYPKIRTFSKTDNSTNSVFRDLEAAEKLSQISSKVDISDLTWEQKEKVLRLLFNKMNTGQGKRGRTAPPALMETPHTLPALSERNTSWDESEETADDQTFLTQAAVQNNRLPHIQSGAQAQTETIVT